ncbi:hypothetical protein BCR32DRAFT_247943 [Anaeromyces robustus]|uniref:Uncharacterized protein n=1 Tax=Anaeromyces robustus TaxID=1754192 RepID=A0A1Y1WV67_9FUNG|nr:hypothetical protein BCR32DRAFT_247943 [Anaeromyces robustus]|eukprot:ORX77440.1 hypothetical protein BCR32DRAFT_247943 [Anaeromyces robustus]
MIINYLFILVVINLLFNCNIVYSKDYPLEQYYIINRNYYNKVINDVQRNPELIRKTVYSGSIYNKIKSLNKNNPNYKEEVTKLLYNGKTVDFGNYFDNDPFDVFLHADKITKNVVLNFTISFGDQIITKRRRAKNRNFQLFNSYYQDDNEKEIINMYKYMMTTGNNLDFDKILNDDINKYPYIESSFNLDYAITSLSNQNILNWILDDNNKSDISNLYNIYGLTVDTNNFLNLVIETLITNNPNIGLFLNSQERFNQFKLIVENIFTNYSFPNPFGIYIASNNTETTSSFIEDLSSDIIQDLYHLYLKINKYVDNDNNNSIIDLVLQELLILNIKEAGVTEEVNITREQFYQSVSEIFNIYKKKTEMIGNIELNEDLSDSLIVEQLTSAHSLVMPNVVGIFIESDEGGKNDLKTIILNYDIIMKYSKNMSKDQQQSLADCANLFINTYSSLNSNDFLNRFLYNRISSGEEFIHNGIIIPYHIDENRDDYFRYIIYAVSLMKQDLNSMFQLGDHLIYGYERNICLEIDDQSYNQLFITNKIDKDCIFKGSKAANEAIYKITKVYYDTFMANCQDDIGVLNSATTGNILYNYLHYEVISDNQILSFHLPTVKMYINSNFKIINSIFNTIFKNHEDGYISAASNLIKKMGLYMIDNNLLYENLYNADEEIEDFELKDIVLPKSKMPEIKEINNKNLNWGDSIIDLDYSNYFVYQYYSLLYYIEDQEEEVRSNFRLDRTILIIKEISKNLIQECQYFGNYYLLKDVLDKYENFVSVITEYIYQYGLSNINSNNYVPDDMIANEYDKLVNAYDNYWKNMESMIDTSYYSLIGDISSEIMGNYMSETIDISNEIKTFFNNKNLNEENEENTNNEHNLIKRNELSNINKYSLYKRLTDEVTQFYGLVFFTVLGAVVHTAVGGFNGVVGDETKAALSEKYGPLFDSLEIILSTLFIGLKIWFPNFMGQADNAFLSGGALADKLFKNLGGKNPKENKSITDITANTPNTHDAHDTVINIAEDSAGTSTGNPASPSTGNSASPSTGNSDNNFEYDGNDFNIKDLDIVEENGNYMISYVKNGKNHKINIKKDGTLNSIIKGQITNENQLNGEDGKQENGSTSQGDNKEQNGNKRQCRDNFTPRKRAVGKSNCNKKQILRESIVTSENVKTTIKNNIGKLDDIDPDNGYKELTDSVEYSNYLSEAFDNADDFSENSKFGEDIDSPISLEDLSNKMKKSTNTLKNNVETAVSEDRLSKSKKRSIRRTNKVKNENAGKSSSNVVNPSSKVVKENKE